MFIYFFYLLDKRNFYFRLNKVQGKTSVYITFNERQKLKENLGKWLGNFIYLFILQQILKHFLSPFDASVPGAFFYHQAQLFAAWSANHTQWRPICELVYQYVTVLYKMNIKTVPLINKIWYTTLFHKIFAICKKFLCLAMLLLTLLLFRVCSLDTCSRIKM